MPYTPPSHHRSPAASAPSSPDVSRRPSLQTSPRPSLPRSSSYLTKHRRTPSAVGPTDGGADQPTPPGTSDDLKGMVSSGTIRQSPPPVADDKGMPKGAVISPPDSASSGSDDDETSRERGRKIENLRELKDAISQLPVRRESSPSPKPDGVSLMLVTSKQEGPKEGMVHSYSTGSLSNLAHGPSRRGTHSRSSTEPKITFSKSAENSLTGSEDESDDDMPRKPQMVRKKSGELVRPALRLSSRRRPSSMPGTPTFSKAVHFDSHLEHVRHFLQVDRPLAVSAGSSPVDSYDSDAEYPFPGDQRSGARSPPYEWEILMANWPIAEDPARKALPVRVERVWLSSDQKSLLGFVAVENIAFQKAVTCRFTLDYWKTTSEVGAEYAHEIRPRTTPAGQDRFQFTIKLSDVANLETKTLYFCVRYNVNGQEHWDSNGGGNFQVDFRKKHLPQNGKRGFQGAASKTSNGLPRSNRRASPSTAPRPKSMPSGFGDFGDSENFNFDQPIHEYLGESGPTALRLKSNKSTGNLPSDNLSSRLSTPVGLAFANRYDFGASLTAAVQAAKDTMGKDRKSDGLYMRSHRTINIAPDSPKPALAASASDPTPLATSGTASAPPVPGAGSPSLASSSYEELVNKYCFFGSKQSSPQLKEGTLRSGRFDGADDGSVTRGSNSADSSLNSSPNMTHHTGGAQHHSVRRDPNPYFHPSVVTTVGASPAGSPLKNIASGSTERFAITPSTTPRQGSQAATPSTLRSASPASMVGSFPPFAGTSPNDFPYAQHLQERFPFSNTDTHAATAIRG